MAYIRTKDRIGTTVNGFFIKDAKRENKRTYFLAVCPYCKKEKWTRADCIISGKNVSCGCYNVENNYVKPVDIKGKKIGKLTAVMPTKKRDCNGAVIWECQCSCGNIVYISEGDFIKNKRVSCGCRAKEIAAEQYNKKLGKFINTNYVFGTNINGITRKKLIKSNTSGRTGVYFKKDRGKWCAQIEFKGKNYYLGSYLQKEDAIRAREIAEKELFGNFLEWYAQEYPEQWKKLKRRLTKTEFQ